MYMTIVHAGVNRRKGTVLIASVALYINMDHETSEEGPLGGCGGDRRGRDGVRPGGSGQRGRVGRGGEHRPAVLRRVPGRGRGQPRAGQQPDRQPRRRALHGGHRPRRTRR
ncbi:hypothetical protein SCOCK_380027 [Actinacidiphila cocklensis]|uniref:Uncharacterized protein n=1 Tax=Actinacidiphila cocklensis TaxID=887465 RepID=A0A9W4DQS6_9ACTN|nr:hypothetical protein SCOCK_380027 [Actinacidiphila cocklensis]